MTWDYIENNPISGQSGTLTAFFKNLEDVLSSQNLDNPVSVNISHDSAMELKWDDEYFDVILTDPPYYDNVPYSDLSNFFYVWLKRSIGDLHPELFATPIAPYKQEIVDTLEMIRGVPKGKAKAIGIPAKDKDDFERMLTQAFKEINRVLKQNGTAVIVYAHKSTSGWETVINALLDSGLVVTSAWPIHTEMKSRLRASESAALASSIYIVARKISRQPTGFYNDVRAELTQHLDTKLHRLWEEGIGGGDFFIAAIGSAIEVFGKYEQVMDFEGNIVRANRLLEEVRVIATNYAVKQILHDEFVTEVSPMARFYVLWRWNYGEALVPFDEANKLAHSCGLDLSLQFGKNGFIKKEKEFARLLGPQGRKLADLDDPRDMIDVLHKTLLLWEKGKRAEMLNVLADRGFGRSAAFYRVAQAISETLPLESKEKKLLDGFLAGRDRVQQEVEKSVEQGKLL
jgi:adenine-specific DNA methylase